MVYLPVCGNLVTSLSKLDLAGALACFQGHGSTDQLLFYKDGKLLKLWVHNTVGGPWVCQCLLFARTKGVKFFIHSC